MPRRKKKATEMTSEELVKDLFHPKVVKHAKKAAKPDEKPNAGRKK